MVFEPTKLPKDGHAACTSPRLFTSSPQNCPGVFNAADEAELCSRPENYGRNPDPSNAGGGAVYSPFEIADLSSAASAGDCKKALLCFVCASASFCTSRHAESIKRFCFVVAITGLVAGFQARAASRDR